MPLVEIIRGEKTSEAAVAKAIDVVQQIRKTPIVVNDSRGFYTSRVIGTQINEGLAMLGEGVRPDDASSGPRSRPATRSVRCRSATSSNMELMVKIRNATKAGVERDGGTYTPAPGREGHRRG